MSLKEKGHPLYMIDLRLVKASITADNTDKNKYDLPLAHHVLIIDLGETE